MIEDDATIASMYRMRLEAEAFDVHVASTGEEGVEQARELRPDAIVLDIMLPGIDGIEVLRQLRGQDETRELPVVVLSNSAGLPDDGDEARRLGINDWLVKSRVSPTELLRRLRDLLES